jgi:hypothetical protein
MRGWLATAVCGDGGYRYGLLQLSDKAAGADFTEEDETRIRELAGLTFPLHSVRPASQDGSDALKAEQVVVRSI